MTGKRVEAAEALDAAAFAMARMVEAASAELAAEFDAGADDLKSRVVRLEALAKAGRAVAMMAAGVSRLSAEKLGGDEETTEDEGMDDHTPDGAAGLAARRRDDNLTLEQKRAEVHRILDRIVGIAPGQGRDRGEPDRPGCGPDPSALVRDGSTGTEAA